MSAAHQERIVCPQCAHVQMATVVHSSPFNTYVHECEFCHYTITESDWEVAKP